MAGQGKRNKLTDKELLKAVMDGVEKGLNRDQIADSIPGRPYKPNTLTARLQAIRNKLNRGKAVVTVTLPDGTERKGMVQTILPALRKELGDKEVDAIFGSHALATVDLDGDKVEVTKEGPDVSWIPTLSGGGAGRQSEPEDIDELMEFAMSLKGEEE